MCECVCVYVCVCVCVCLKVQVSKCTCHLDIPVEVIVFQGVLFFPVFFVTGAVIWLSLSKLGGLASQAADLPVSTLPAPSTTSHFLNLGSGIKIRPSHCVAGTVWTEPSSQHPQRRDTFIDQKAMKQSIQTQTYFQIRVLLCETV